MDLQQDREQRYRESEMLRWLMSSDFTIFGSPHAVELDGLSLYDAILAGMAMEQEESNG